MAKLKKKPVAALLDVPFDEAIEYAESRGVMLPGEFYGDLKKAVAQRAFTVSHIASVRQIADILKAANKAVSEGSTFTDWQKAAGANLDGLTMAHRETVFRNAVQTSYGSGTRKKHVAGEGSRPILMYDAINDSRTRDSHRQMDGFMAPVSDVVWREWSPPNGHNCRCSTISLTVEQAKARGYKPGTRRPNVKPDPGWDFDPSEGSAVDRSMGVILKNALDELPPVMKLVSGKVVMARRRGSK